MVFIKSESAQFREHRCILIGILNSFLSEPDVFKGTCEELVLCLLNILKFDSPSNAISALRIIVDLHKVFRLQLESTVPHIIDFAVSTFSTLPSIIKGPFNEYLTSEANDGKSFNFKLIMEIPVMVVMIFQLHRKFIADNVNRFLGPIVDILVAEPVLDVNIASNETKKSIYHDFIASKVKILSFFAYISRSFIAFVRMHIDVIPKIVLRLFELCPLSSIIIRKELLIATRHILTTELRAGFQNYLEFILNERLIIGPENSSLFLVLRPLGYSMMADFLHHIRFDLPSQRLVEIILRQCSIVLDNSLPLNLQIMNVKLVLNLLEPALRDDFDPETRNHICEAIFSCFVSKIELFAKIEVDRFSPLSEPCETNLLRIINDSLHLYPLNHLFDSSVKESPVRELKVLFKIILSGLKTLIALIRTVISNDTIRLSFHFFNLLNNLLRNGIRGLSILIPVNLSSNEFMNSSMLLNTSISAEDKELLDHFAYLFSVIDTPMFHDLIDSNLSFLYEEIARNLALLAIPQYFLAITGISKHFSSILIHFLCGKLQSLGDGEGVNSLITLRLFKLLFLSVSVYPEDNESILLPHISDIIVESVNLSKNCSSPFNYFLLLRSLFRSIGGGRFESLYKEVHNLLPNLLEQFAITLANSCNSALQNEIIVELCLTTPVRLSVLLPHLQYLMRPLLFALKSNSELKTQGMRTLELCIDNLMQEYMEPVIQPVIKDLTYSLIHIIHSEASTNSQINSAIRVLGKLGGKSRRISYQDAEIASNFNSAQLPPIRLLLSSSDAALEISLSEIFSIIKGRNSECPDKILDSFISIFNRYLGQILSSLHNDIQTDLVPNFTNFVLLIFEIISYNTTVTEYENANAHLVFELMSQIYSVALQKNVSSICEQIASFSSEFLKFILDLQAPLYEFFINAFVFSLKSILQTSEGFRKFGEIPLLYIIIDNLIGHTYSLDRLVSYRACMSLIKFQCLPFDISWIWLHETRILKSLVFAAKSFSFNSKGQEFQTLSFEVIKIVEKAALFDKDDHSRNNRAYFSNLLKSFLVSEITSQDLTVCELIQAAISKYCDTLPVSLYDLLIPFKDRLITPIFAKPLRALPVSLQIGYINAVDYYFNINAGAPILSLNEEILRFVHETLSLADAEDCPRSGKLALSTSFIPSITLRVVALKFLATAITFPDFQQTRLQQTRNHIVTLFFKALYSKNLDVVDIARKGLEKLILNQHKLPKDLLQSGLRPVLTNLTDSKRLTVSSLEGLSRLLKLLTSYFKPEIGRKMLEHISAWTDSNVLQAAAEKSLSSSNEVCIITGLFSIFPLLPSPANVFIPDVIQKLVHIEANLRRSVSCPFRAHVFDFLDQNPQIALEYFWENAGEVYVARLFDQLLSMHSRGLNLVKAFADNFERLCILMQLNSPCLFYHLGIAKSVLKCTRANTVKITQKCLVCIFELLDKLNNHFANISFDIHCLVFDIASRFINSCSFSEPLIFIIFKFICCFSSFGMNLFDDCLKTCIESASMDNLSVLLSVWISQINDPNSQWGQSFLSNSIRHLIIPIFTCRIKRQNQFALPPSILMMFSQIRKPVSQFICIELLQLFMIISSISHENPSSEVSFSNVIFKTFLDSDEILSFLPQLLLLKEYPEHSSKTLDHSFEQLFVNFSFEIKGIIFQLLKFNYFSLISVNSPTVIQSFGRSVKKIFSPDGHISPGITLFWFCVSSSSRLLSDDLIDIAINSFVKSTISLCLAFDINLPFDFVESLIFSSHNDTLRLKKAVFCALKLLFSFQDATRDLKLFSLRAKSLILSIKPHISDFSIANSIQCFIKSASAIEGLDEASVNVLNDSFADILFELFVSMSDAALLKSVGVLLPFIKPFLFGLSAQRFESWKKLFERLYLIQAFDILSAFSEIFTVDSEATNLTLSRICLLSVLFKSEIIPSDSHSIIINDVGKLIKTTASDVFSTDNLLVFKAFWELFRLLSSSPNLSPAPHFDFLIDLSSYFWSSCTEPQIMLDIATVLSNFFSFSPYKQKICEIFVSNTACSIPMCNEYEDLAVKCTRFDPSLCETKFILLLLSDIERVPFLRHILAFLPSNISSRFAYILAGQNWYLANRYFLHLWFNLIKDCISAYKLQIDDFQVDDLPADVVLDLLKYVVRDTEMCSASFTSILGSFLLKVSSSDLCLIEKSVEFIFKHNPSKSTSRDYSKCIKAISESLYRFSLNTSICPSAISFSASSHGAWFSSILSLESRVFSDNLDVLNSLSSIFSCLNDRNADIYIKMLNLKTQQAKSCALLLQHDFFAESQSLIEAVFDGNSASLKSKINQGEIVSLGDFWIECSMKLQQWDLLEEIFRYDSNKAQALISSWNRIDTDHDHLLNNLRSFFIGLKVEEIPYDTYPLGFYYAMQHSKDENFKISDAQELLSSYSSQTLNRWHTMPKYFSSAHSILLSECQLLVEMQESQPIFLNSSNPGGISRPHALQELKGIFGTWRDRLPNKWESIDVWKRLLTWRQHVYTFVNASLSNSASSEASSGSSSQSFACRGYHEMAWSINRFAKIARLNGMRDLAISSLNKIYSLPNIEVPEAFFKLKEQAKCYLNSASDLPTALDVINATNIGFFHSIQKAEFFALKADVMSRLGLLDEANRVFAQAVQIDLNLAKGWALWGSFNDQRFRQLKDITYAVNAINCYLQATTILKYPRIRKFLSRILWILTFESSKCDFLSSFELYNNDIPIWYWIIFIPSLVHSLQRNERDTCHHILSRLSKFYPQSIFYNIRVAVEEAVPLENLQVHPKFCNLLSSLPSVDKDSSTEQEKPKLNLKDALENLLSSCKASHPLLCLTMENFADHIINRLRVTAEEELYRVLSVIFSEAFQISMNRLGVNAVEVHPEYIANTRDKIVKFVENSPSLSDKYLSKIKSDLSQVSSIDDFVNSIHSWKGLLLAVIHKLPKKIPLESFSRYLSEFPEHKYEDMEVPGFYSLLRDSAPESFPRILRLAPFIFLGLLNSSTYRKISVTSFSLDLFNFDVQAFCTKLSRREESCSTLLKFMDFISQKSIKSRRVGSHYPSFTFTPLSLSIRLRSSSIGNAWCLDKVNESSASTSSELLSDKLALNLRDLIKSGLLQAELPIRKGNVDLLNLRVDIFETLVQKNAAFSRNAVQKYISRNITASEDYWVYRRNFTISYASFIASSYIFTVNNRIPSSFFISGSKGMFCSADFIPNLSQNGQFILLEPVPFRFTPSIQLYMSEIQISSLLVPNIILSSQAMLKHDGEWRDHLHLFIRDELIRWAVDNSNNTTRTIIQDSDSSLKFTEDVFSKISQNIEICFKRALSLSCLKEMDNPEEILSSCQTVFDLLSCASNPQKLVQMDGLWHPWL